MQNRGSSELPSFEQARALVESYAAQLPLPAVEKVSLLEADSRVLAAEIRADRDFPPFHRATRDGFAVRAADVASTPAKLAVIGELAAGASSRLHLESGQTAEIMTGAPLPDGADAVVMVEYTRRDGGSVRHRSFGAARRKLRATRSRGAVRRTVGPRAKPDQPCGHRHRRFRGNKAGAGLSPARSRHPGDRR